MKVDAIKNQGHQIPGGRLIRVVLSLFLLTLSIFFPFRLLKVVLSVGENNLSNDYLAFTNPVTQIAYDGLQLNNLNETCFGGQCEPLPLMLMGWGVRFFNWNVHAEIVFSVAVAFVTAVLVYLSIVGVTVELKRLWLLVFISAFSFSFTLISTYTFGQAAIYTTSAFLGVSLGIFSIKMLPNTLIGFILLIFGMLIAVWSYGGGLFSIPILFIGSLIGFRKFRYRVLWLLSAIIISMPYIQYLLQPNNHDIKLNILSFFRLGWILRLLGLFFSNELWLSYPGKQPVFDSVPIIYGITGFVLLCVGLLLALYKHKIRFVSVFYAELALISFGLGPIWLASLFRNGIAPWYVSNSLPFWLGLLGLYYSTISTGNLINRSIDISIKRGTLVLLLIVFVLYLHSNAAYEDKIFHLMTRAPSSASCLRHSSTAPTYCEPFLFQWGLGNPSLIYQLGAPLEKNRLSVYAPNQEWLLQGDYLLNSVSIYPSSSGHNPFWRDNHGNAKSWADYHRLDLVLPSGSSVEWQVRLPDKADQIVLVSSLEAASGGVEIQLQRPDFEASKFQFKVGDADRSPIRIDLVQYAGQNIKIIFSSKDTNGAVVTLDAPRLMFSEDGTNSFPLQEYQPQNVKDLELTGNFYNIWPSQSSKVAFDKLDAEKHNFYKREGDGWLSLDAEDGICLHNETNFYVTIAIDSAISQRYGVINIQMKNLDGLAEYATFYLPYLADGNSHTYLYPMRLQLSTSPSHLEGILVRPLLYSGAASFRIESMGFFDPYNIFNQCK